jgi:hypothetical protein
MSKLDTVKLQGKDYALVPTRIKEFRNDCPQGLIETFPEFLEDGQVLFKARVLKDKENPNSAEGTGHALSKLDKDKSFEKLETIAVGRALAMLGYMASGDVASGEEMAEFIEYKKTKQEEELEQAQVEIKALNTLEELKDYYEKNKGKGKDFDKLLTLRKQEILKNNENTQN